MGTERLRLVEQECQIRKEVHDLEAALLALQEEKASQLREQLPLPSLITTNWPC